MNACIGGAEVTPEAQVLLMIIAQQRAGQFEEIRIGIGVAGGLSKRGQLEIDIAGEFAFPGYRLRTRVS